MRDRLTRSTTCKLLLHLPELCRREARHQQHRKRTYRLLALACASPSIVIHWTLTQKMTTNKSHRRSTRANLPLLNL